MIKWFSIDDDVDNWMHQENRYFKPIGCTHTYSWLDMSFTRDYLSQLWVQNVYLKGKPQPNVAETYSFVIWFALLGLA